MKEYRYKGYTIRRTSTTTQKHIKPAGSLNYREVIRNLYEIVDLKDRGSRPFLTTIQECKEYIDECNENCQNYEISGWSDYLRLLIKQDIMTNKHNA